MRPIDIKESGYKHYVHSDWSMNLRADSKRVDNANGILYLGIFHELLEQCGLYDDGDRQAALKATTIIKVEPGLYSKTSEHPLWVNSHDNYVALASLGCAEDICDYGNKHGWIFDNTYQEESPREAYRQLGEVAFYKIEAGYIPNLLELAWLVVGLIVAGCVSRVPSHHLAWYRVARLRRSIVKTLSSKRWLMINVPLIFACLTFDLLMLIKHKSRWAPITRYYSDENHPNKKLAYYLKEREHGKTV